MKVEMPAEKAKEIEECAAKIAELLQAAKSKILNKNRQM